MRFVWLTLLGAAMQVRGEKRMLFWPPEQLPLMRPFPSSHLMRRRCQTPLENAPQPLCAALHPGDAVFFPPEWWVPNRAVPSCQGGGLCSCQA